jgi:hypothetical protein
MQRKRKVKHGFSDAAQLPVLLLEIQDGPDMQAPG